MHRAVSARFDVVLRQPRQRALTAFLSSLYNPASSNYHHFLTPASFGARFGASTRAIKSVADYFTGFGLHVTTVNTAHTLMALRGSSRNVARAFATPVESVRTASGALVAQFVRPASVPSSIAVDVTHVVGLSSTLTPSPQLAQPRSQPRASSGATSGPTVCPSAGDATTNGPNQLFGYTAQQQAQLYGLNSAWSAGDTGVGQTIALYELGLYSQSDVATYFSCYGVSPPTSSVSVDGGPGTTTSDEATLDVEEAGVLAPGANLVIYQGPNNNTGPLDTYARIADDNTANIVSTSWGTCETDPTGDVAGEQVIFQQMAAQGQTVLAAAGDSGSSDCSASSTSSTQLAVDDPASQPFVTGVGGLSVTSISPLVESVWNQTGGNSTCGGSGGGGGGQSVIWSRPSWQVTTGATANVTMRMVPDLSVMGDPSTGFIQYYPSTGSCATPGWFTVGGTSIGAPLVSSLVAVATQACNQGRLGFLNPQLYQMPSSDFVDVTAGNNDLYGVGGYSAGVGYDMASGLGSPNGAAFLSGLCPNLAADPSRSSFVNSTGNPVAQTSDASVSATLLNTSGAALVNEPLVVNATSSSGQLTINDDPASRQGIGAATSQITTDTSGTATTTISDSRPGAVKVDLTYRGVTLYSTTFNFVAGANSRHTPSAPRIGALVALSGGFTMRVIAPSDAGAGSVTRYQYSLNGTNNWRSFNSSTLTVRHLLRHHAYTVRVRALNAYGASPLSAAKRVVTKS
ncbi:MAG: hypothetical protein B7X07_04060 [Actinobacteria bacterium 21-64-8]|nr:MAG: hypothetical protein B7X07_04060 [Actinobacteria bacterium 21-64-8]